MNDDDVSYVRVMYDNYDNYDIQDVYEEYYILTRSGKKHGQYKSYYFGGRIEIKCNYVNGKRHGGYEFRSSYGVVIVRCEYNNGDIHGLYEEFYDFSGVLRYNATYIDNKIHGFKYNYDVNGKLLKKRLYSMGVEVDVSIHGMDINNLTDNDINLLRLLYD